MGPQEHFLKGQSGIPLVIELSYYINSRRTDILWASWSPVAPLCGVITFSEQNSSGASQ